MTDIDHRSLAKVKQRIEARLRPICPGMPDAAFQAMVDRMARVQLKYDALRADESAAILAAVTDEPAIDAGS